MTIDLKNVCVGYDKKAVLDHVDLSFESGHFYCILGANGIGKTTLFKAILGFIPILGGELHIDGKPIDSISPKELSEYLAYVPQAKDNSYDMSVLEVVVMGRARFIKKFSQPSEDDYRIADDILKKLEIERLRDKKYTELSGGEQQIVLIARALVQESRFIIMDEPASNLDFENQKKVLDSLMNLSGQGIGIVLTSHSPDHAIYCNTEVVIIDKEKKIHTGNIGDTLTNEILRKVYGVDVQLIQGYTKSGSPVMTCCLVNGGNIS